MAFTGRMTALIEHDLIGPANQSQLGFAFNTDKSREQCAAAIIGYLHGIGGVFAAGAKLVGINSRAQGAAGATPVTFPTVEYSALRALAPATFPAVTAYGPLTGSTAALCPLGTSISVTEATLTAGPRGRGRHYLPYISTICVAANGGLVSSVANNIRAQYRKAMGFEDLGASVTAPRVVPAVTGADVPIGPTLYLDISEIKPQSVLSNLRSRRR